MLRVICREVRLTSGGEIAGEQFVTFDVEEVALEAYLRGAPEGVTRSVVGAEVLAVEVPQPEPVPEPADSTLLMEVKAGVPVDERVFGMTILHAGQPWFNPQMTPEGGETGRMLFKCSRQFASWSAVEKVAGVYDWSAIEKRADYFAARNLEWSLVLSPVAPPPYSSGLRGPATTEAPYRKVVLAAMTRFWSKGLRAHEICNEPETDNWYGSLGHKPLSDKERRQTARELAPWARVAKEAANEYFGLTGNRVEIWASSSQSMANADPATGLARVFNDPSLGANTAYGGLGFLNGPDGQGGTGAQWLDRFTFHGYPSPTHDGAMLHAHFMKAKAWLAGAGVPDIPMVVTEHGVLSVRSPTNGNRSNGQLREWKTDEPYTGKPPPFTDTERVRWVLNAFAVSAMHGARMIWYAWDEQYMGIYGYPNGTNGGSSTAPLGWSTAHARIEQRYGELRDALVGSRIYALWRRNSDGLLIVRVGPSPAQSTLFNLE